VCNIALQTAATTTATMANGPLRRQPSRPPATPTAPEYRPMMEGDARYHRAAIGEVNSAAAAIIAAECTPPQESR